MRNINQEIKNIIENNSIVLFMKGTVTTPMCGFSGFVVQVLNKLNVPFYAINVLEDAEIRQAIKSFSNWPTIPQLYVNKEFIGGADIIKEMHQNGEIQKLLSPSSN